MLADRVRETVFKALMDCGFGETQLRGAKDIQIETPKQRDHGDYSTNLAMLLAKPLKKKPRDIAEALAARLQGAGPVESAEVAGPGFINIKVKADTFREVLPEADGAGGRWGWNDSLKGSRIQVEFVSANPTGPLSVGHGRLAAFGDALASILAACGADVTREYYVNDVGNQIANLAKSVEQRYLEMLGERSNPEDIGYQGEYIKEYAAELLEKRGDSLLREDVEERRKIIAGYTIERVLREQAESLEKYGVKFDRWFRESELYAAGMVDDTLKLLQEKGHIFEQEGALWFKSTAFEDTQDRVLKKSEGMPTYFLSDIAYHRNKFDRGFGTVIDIWGADHHGYIPRMKSSMSALGLDAANLEILIVQLVRFKQSGVMVRMSKRLGNMVSLSELAEEVGTDVSRFFFLMRTKDTHLDFDIDLAKDKSEANPMYYLQYAHARICSLLRKAADQGLKPAFGANLALLEEPRETTLMKRVADFPWEMTSAGAAREPHRIINFMTELAGDFHTFYHDLRVVDREKPELSSARLALCAAVRNVLAGGLSVMGISAPDTM